MEVELDVSAREMDENRGGTHETERESDGLHRAIRAGPLRHRREGRHDQGLGGGVEERVVLSHRGQTELPAISADQTPERDQGYVAPGESDQETAPLLPERVGEGASRRQVAPQAPDRRAKTRPGGPRILVHGQRICVARRVHPARGPPDPSNQPLRCLLAEQPEADVPIRT